VKNPLVLSLVTTLSAFIPLLLGDYLIRMQYMNFIIVITVILLFSFVISMGITPMVYYISYLNGWKFHLFKKNAFENKIKEIVLRTLRVSLRNRKFIMYSVFISLAILPLMFYLINVRPPATSYLNEIKGVLEFPSGSSLDYTSEISKKVETEIKKNPVVKSIVSRVEKSHVGYIINFKKRLSEKDIRKMFDSKGVSDIPEGVSLILDYSSETTKKSGKEIEVNVYDENLDELPEVTRKIAHEIYLKSRFRDIIFHFKEGNPSYDLNIDYVALGTLGWNLSDIISYLRILFYGIIPTKFMGSMGLIDIRLRSDLNPTNKDQLYDILLQNEKGAKSYLSQIAKIDKSVSPTKIYHKNKRRLLSFSLRLDESKNVFYAVKEVENIVKEAKLPSHISVDVGSKVREEGKSFKNLWSLILVSVYVVMAVMIFIYEKFKVPILIFLTIPFSYIGTAIFDLIFHINFNQFVFLALIFLAGIGVNSSVLLYDGIEDSKNFEGEKKVIKAVDEKCISVITTTFTTLFGILPFLFTGFGGVWFDFAITLTGGIVFGFMFSLFVFPLFFVMREKDFSGV
jgi:multidrug efflux pump subunit AcrB